MTRQEAIEISNLAGSMLKQTEERVARLHGINYPIGHIDNLPYTDRNFIENMRACRQQIAHKLREVI